MKLKSAIHIFREKQGFVLVILLAGLGLFFAAFPRLRASLNHIPVDTAIGRLNDRKALKLAKIPELIEITRASLDLNDNAGYWSDLSTLQYKQANQEGEFSSAGKASLVEAKRAVEQSLMRSPGNAFLWYRLSVIMAFQQARPEAIVEALLMSLMTGPHEPGFMLNRLMFCLMFFSSFNPDDLSLLIAQVIAVWNMSDKEFVKMIRQDDEYLDNIRTLLKNSRPQMFEEMVTAVEKTG